MDVYFGSRFRAKLTLVEGRIFVKGPGQKDVASILDHYRVVLPNDQELYARLPRLLRGYWHTGGSGD